jgi:site-specific recombinase XerD
VQQAGGAAAFAWDEFSSGEIRSPNTRRAYTHAVHQFLAWVASQGVELARIAPGQVGQYIDQVTVSLATKKQHLAALKGFFDRLVLRLEHGVPLEDVRHLAGHADPRTTRLYDRRQKNVTRNVVERISIRACPERHIVVRRAQWMTKD